MDQSSSINDGLTSARLHAPEPGRPQQKPMPKPKADPAFEHTPAPDPSPAPDPKPPAGPNGPEPLPGVIPPRPASA